MGAHKNLRSMINATLGLLALWLFLRRYRGPNYMPGWEKVIQARYGYERGREMVTEVRKQLAVLYADTPLPKNRTLRWHLRENILPGLALYRVLLKEHAGDPQAATGSFESVVRAWTIARSRFMLMPLKVLPAPFFWFRLVFPQVMRQYPPEGWDINVVENSNTKIAFNITRCYYLNTLAALGTPELTASFCMGDDVMAELFPGSIKFIRPHTLGRGDAVCDFQYCVQRLNVETSERVNV
jgi:hypothetical protein